MVEFKLPNHKGRIFLKAELKNLLDSDVISARANEKAVVLYPENADLNEVKKSLELIIGEIDHCMELSNNAKKNGPKPVTDPELKAKLER